jgi:acetylornithine deacetylase
MNLLLDHMHQLVATPSVSCTHGPWNQSNHQIIDLLSNWFKDTHFQVSQHAIPGYAGKYNMVAKAGTGSGGLLLSGHSDTVPFDESLWQHNPLKLTQHNQRFYGLGSADMKCFFALVLEAVRQLEPKSWRAPLWVVATADEESSMCGIRYLAQQAQINAKFAVIGEPTDLTPVNRHKGIMMEAVRISGQSGHSSNPALGHNALEAMSAVLQVLISWREQLQSKYKSSDFAVPFPTLNLGYIHGGDNPNRICGACELHLDIRPLPGMSLQDLRTDMRQLLLPVATQHQVQLKIESLFPGVAPMHTSPGSEIVRQAEEVSGKSCQSVAFCTEAPFLNDMGIETVILGPGSIQQAHQPDEYLEASQIKPTIQILKKLIYHHCIV